MLRLKADSIVSIQRLRHITILRNSTRAWQTDRRTTHPPIERDKSGTITSKSVLLATLDPVVVSGNPGVFVGIVVVGVVVVDVVVVDVVVVGVVIVSVVVVGVVVVGVVVVGVVVGVVVVGVVVVVVVDVVVVGIVVGTGIGVVGIGDCLVTSYFLFQ